MEKDQLRLWLGDGILARRSPNCEDKVGVERGNMVDRKWFLQPLARMDNCRHFLLKRRVK